MVVAFLGGKGLVGGSIPPQRQEGGGEPSYVRLAVGIGQLHCRTFCTLKHRGAAVTTSHCIYDSGLSFDPASEVRRGGGTLGPGGCVQVGPVTGNDFK